MQLANAAFFREQLQQFRPIEAIQADIRHALRSAGAMEDVLACVRLVLCAAEMGQRSNVIDQIDLPELLLRLGLGDAVAEHIFDGAETRLGDVAAMKMSHRLLEVGCSAEARWLFERGEPFDAFLANDDYLGKAQEKEEALAEWVKAAVHFRPVDQIAKMIESVRRPPRLHPETSAEEESAATQQYLLFVLTITLDAIGKHAAARSIEARFDTATAHGFDYWFWIRAREWKRLLDDGSKAIVREEVAPLLTDARFGWLSAEGKAFLAETAYLALGPHPHVVQLAKSIEQPKTDFEPSASDSGFSPYLLRFRLNRLLTALGDGIASSTIVPDVSRPEYQGLVLLDRAVITVAQIWGDAWRGRKYSVADVQQRVFGLLRLYDRDPKERRNWSGWHTILGVQTELYQHLISAVAEHGQEALTELERLLVAEWTSARGHFWSSNLRRAILLRLYEVGADVAEITKQLRHLEPSMLSGRDISGRVGECEEQANAYGAIGDVQAARQWAKEMMSVSFGVGYRKDSQLDAWIGWLPQINAKDPAGAARRFAWFARAAVSLEETTEGRSARSASERLVEIACAWSPRRGLLMLLWLMKQQVVWYTECLQKLLLGMIRREPEIAELGVITLVEFLMWFDKQAEPALTEELVTAAVRTQGGQLGCRLAEYIEAAISSTAFPSTRRGWAEGLVKGLSANYLPVPDAVLRLSLAESHEPETTKSDESVTRRSGGKLQGEELARRSATIEEVLELAQQSVDSSFHKWRGQFESVAANASLGDVRRLVAAAKKLPDSSLTLSMLSRRLMALGDRNGAWETALMAFQASNDYGWTSYSDGGTRIQALEALVEAKPTEGRRFAFRTFIQDMTSPRLFAGGTSQNLLNIVSLFTEQVPIEALWQELEIYLFALCPAASSGDVPDLSQELADDTGARAVGDLLAHHIQDLTHVLARGAQHALGEMLVRTTEAVLPVVRELLRGPDNAVLPTVTVLASVAERDLEPVRHLEKELKDLLEHPHFGIWRTAREILEKICTHPLPGREPKPLPAVYHLELPNHTPGIGNNLLPEPGEPMPDTDDPIRRLAPFHVNLEWVAKVRDAPKENLLYRAAELMTSIAPQETWTSSAEATYRQILDAADLKFTYVRPRAQVARHAMFRAISELCDARIVPREQEDLFWEFLRPYDTTLMLERPKNRPSACVSVQELDQWGKVSKEWLKIGDNAAGRVMRVLGERIVLAEATTLRRLTWEEPEERVRAGVVACTEIARTPSPFRQLGTTHVAKHYLRLPHDRVLHHLAIQNQGQGLDSDGSEWLAFNPDIAQLLGWTLERDGLFRWRGQNGEITVESLWWRDGLLDHRPPEHEFEVGEGWLVLCSPEAFGIMAAQLGILTRVSQILRSFTVDGQELSGSHSVIETLLPDNVLEQ